VALGEYTHSIAPALGGQDRPVAQPRLTGAELLETPSGRKTSVRVRLGRLAVDRLDDVRDAGTRAADVADAVGKFRALPKDPGPGHAVTSEPASDTPVARREDSDSSGSTAVEAAITVATVMLNWKRFRKRMKRMFEAKASDGNP
jgi:hypothetical protein